VAGEFLHQHNPQARLTLYGQELNDESYAICKADMLIKGQDVGNIVAGNTLSDDGHAQRRFDYMLSNRADINFCYTKLAMGVSLSKL
jgi:type I restriction enzyme M protein